MVKNFLLLVCAVAVCVLSLAPEAEARGRRGGGGGFFRRNNCQKFQVFNRTCRGPSCGKVQIFKGRTTRCSGGKCTVTGGGTAPDLAPAPASVPAPVVDDAPPAAASLQQAPPVVLPVEGSSTSSEDLTLIEDAPPAEIPTGVLK